jgi:hypothetical protein
MSVLTVLTRATGLKLLLDVVEGGTELACQELKVCPIQCGEDTEHADPPFLK